MSKSGRSNYGYGWVIAKSTHGGTRFSRSFLWLPAVVIVLSNVENASGLVNPLLAKLFGEKAEVSWEREEVLENGRLVAQTPGKSKLPLPAESESKCLLRAVRAPLEVTGESPVMIFLQRAQELREKRIP
jgi:hypothetical protein